jgi:hypothetical protein
VGRNAGKRCLCGLLACACSQLNCEGRNQQCRRPSARPDAFCSEGERFATYRQVINDVAYKESPAAPMFARLPQGASTSLSPIRPTVYKGSTRDNSRAPFRHELLTTATKASPNESHFAQHLRAQRFFRPHLAHRWSALATSAPLARQHELSATRTSPKRLRSARAYKGSQGLIPPVIRTGRRAAALLLYKG